MSDLDLWPRIRQAIDGAGVSRSAVESVWPECHRKNCRNHHSDNPDAAFAMMARQISDAIYVELLCKATSEPDVGDQGGLG